jgi:hypothetical protein
MASHQPVTSVSVASTPPRILANFASTVVVFSLLWGSVSTYAQSAAVSSIAPPTAVSDLEPLGKKPEMEKIQPLVNWLPIWGQGAREKGFDLPLPFGVGPTYTYIHQNMVISDVKIEGTQLKLKLPDAPTTTSTGVFRADVWLFPFLNVYGLVGETAVHNRTVSRVP